MAFDAGQIQASLDLDINPFQRALDQARADARAFAAGDTRATLGANADTAGASAELDRLKVKAEDVSATRVNIQATADTARAQAELEALKLKADEASGAAGGAGAGGGISGLVATGVALGPALVPVLGTITAGLGAALVPLTAATVGFGSLGAFAIPAIKEISKSMGPLNKDLQQFEASQPGPAQSLAWAKLQQDIAKLPPELRPVAQGIIDVELEIRNLGQTAGVNQALYGAFGTFLSDIKILLPQIAPAAKETALALNDLGVSAGKALDSPAWHNFLDKIVPEIRPAIDAIGRSLGELIKGFGGVVEAFVPFAGGFEAGMVRITTAFANWGQRLGDSQGFKDFMQWVKDNEGAVGTAIKNIAQAIENIVKASAGLGGLEIRALGDLAKVLGAIASVPVLGPAAVDIGFLALAVGKLSQAIQGSALIAGISKLIGVGGAAGGGLLGIGAASGEAAGVAGLGALLPALIPLAPALVAVAGGAGLVALAVAGLHNNYAGMVQVVSTGEPILSDAGTKIDEVRAAAQRLTDTVGAAGPAFKAEVGQIDQALGQLAPDLSNKGIQAEQALANAIKNGQAPNMASIDADNILKAYNQLLQIPGIGAQVMGALSSSIDSHGKQLGQVVLDQVHGLISQYGQLAPGVQQQVLKAMSDLQAGLATGNQGMINNAKAQLALLTGAYGQAGANIVATGNQAFGQLVTDVTAKQNQLSAQTNYAVGILINSYQRLPPPIQAAASLAMGNLDAALNSGNKAAIDSASQAVNFMVENYQRLPPPVQTAATDAMNEFKGALASGNQAALEDAERKLSDLEARYGATVPPIGRAGSDAGDGFGAGMAQKLRDQLPNVQGVLAQYDKAIADGINPVLAVVGAQIDPGVRLALNVGTGGAFGHESGGFITSGPQYLVGEGNPAYPEAVIPTDPTYRGNAKALHRWVGEQIGGPGGCGGACGMEAGGIIGLQGGGLCKGADDLFNWLRGQGINATISSGFRPGAGLHGTGQAIDLVGDFGAIVGALNRTASSLAEGIHNEAGGGGRLSIKNGGVVDPSFWGPETWAEHMNHVHAAVANCGGFEPGSGAAMITCPPGAFCSGADVPKPPSFAQWGGQANPFMAGASTEGWLFNRGANQEYQVAVAVAEQAKAARDAANAAAASSAGVFPGGRGGGDRAANIAIAASLIGNYGWGQDQMSSLIPLWDSESGWSTSAKNPTSSAHGIPQSLGPMGPAADAGNAEAQINWGLNYIKGRYGSPAGAWSFWQGHHWYEKGGLIPGGVFDSGGILEPGNVAINTGKVPEAVVPLGQGGAFGGNVTIDARIVFQGDVTDNIDARIQRAHAAQADRITRKLGLRGVTPAPGGVLR